MKLKEHITHFLSRRASVAPHHDTMRFSDRLQVYTESENLAFALDSGSELPPTILAQNVFHNMRLLDTGESHVEALMFH